MNIKRKKYAKPFFIKFKEICKDFDIDLDDYLISESERDEIIKELKSLKIETDNIDSSEKGINTWIETLKNCR